MEPQFWHERWRKGQIGFHQTTVDSNLKRHWPALGLAPGTRVFVPLCGKSLDLVWLRERGHFVAGVELSAAALESFCLENGVAARRRTRGDFDVYEAPGFELFRGDFFRLTPALLGEPAAVYDRAALIAWAPPLRAPYAEHIAELTGAGTDMLLITLEYPQTQMSGPPFSVTRADVERLYARHFRIREIAREDILPQEPRWRALGLRELTEVSYHLVRM